ncbi:helix-turn-helix domain-containing protein [Enterococcus gilvus]|uniref:helix-turn-helix domain-containing protein n=1 Tax=Enterococcus gilvus TaxID=160453 RepID=UPI003ED8FE34
MTVFERIKKLANNQGKGVSKVATDLGFSENLFYRWKTSEPKARDLQKVADYFNVSVDYLLGRTDDLNPIAEPDKGPGSDLIGYFRLNTAEFDPDETEQIEDSLKEYTDFLVQKARERKAREERKKKK